MRGIQTSLFFLSTLCATFAADDSYQLQIEKDRKETREFLRSEKGPLLLIGRFTVQEGDSKIGSDPTAQFRFPSRAPGLVGTIHRRGKDVSFESVPDVSVSLNGKPASGRFPLQAVPAPNPSDRVTAGDFTFAIRPIGDQFVLLVIDAQSELLKNFSGPTWFPVNTAYRVEAQLQPEKPTRNVTVQMTDGNSATYQVAGNLLFQCAGQKLRLRALISPDKKSLSVFFRDQTSGKETYGGGRFLEADLPKEGRTILDFNKAYNPYCAYNPYAICPVVPRENRLSVAIRAGETLETPSKH